MDILLLRTRQEVLAGIYPAVNFKLNDRRWLQRRWN
jgi:hypothetical protein